MTLQCFQCRKFLQARRLVSAAILAALCFFPGPSAAAAETVSQGDWARFLVEAMGLSEAIAEGDPATRDYVDFLSGEPRAKQTVWAETVRPLPQGARRQPDAGDATRQWIRAGGEPISAHYRVKVMHPGIYALRFRGDGPPQQWRVAKGEVRMARPAGKPGQAAADGAARTDLLGHFVLPRGAHDVSVEIPPGGGLLFFELLRQPFPHVRPPGGWQPGAPLTFGAKAVTMIQAMELEHELPDVARWRVEREGERYDESPLPGVRSDSARSVKASAGAWLRGAVRGSRAVYLLPIAKGGTYSLLARVTGGGDGRLLLNDLVERGWRGARPADHLVWRNLVTLPLQAGEQEISVSLEADAGLDVMRLIYRDTSPEAALMLLKDLGFEESAAGDPVTLNAARDNLENREFQDRVRKLLASFYTQPGAGMGPASGPSPIPSPGLILTEKGEVTPTDTPPSISP